MGTHNNRYMFYFIEEEGYVEKTKLAICIADEQYQTRFVKCILKHYKESYEVHVINQEYDKETCDVMILDETSLESKSIIGEPFVLVLKERAGYEHGKENESYCYTEMYQEVYKIMEELEKAFSKEIGSLNVRRMTSDVQIIGVSSFDNCSLQVPFIALLAETLGEKQRVLVIDFQPYSGFETELEIEDDYLGMEDILSVAVTECYTRNRLMASIGHEQKWDYIYPVKNVSCLTEITESIYKKLMELLKTEMCYNWIIVNFGTSFLEADFIMKECHSIYLLTERREERSWREESFLREIRRNGRDVNLDKFTWIEMPKEPMRENSWQALVKKWLWSEMGDFVRNISWMAGANG